MSGYDSTQLSLLVVGIGNEIRCDDAVGLEVADAVAGRTSKQPRVTVKKLSAGGWQLLHEIEGYDRLVVVDAFFSRESQPGLIRVHSGEKTMPTGGSNTAFAHLLSIPDALALSVTHGYHTPRLVGMVTIDVGESCLGFGTGLSPDVAAAVPGAVEAVLELLETA